MFISADRLNDRAHKALYLRTREPDRRRPNRALCLSLFFVAIGGGPQSPSAAPAYVQGNYAVPQGPQTTVSVAYPAAQTAGNLNVVIVGWNDTTAAINSVTDSTGNVYQLAVGPTLLSGALSQSIYYAAGISPAADGANAVTVAFNSAAQYPDVRILEYRELDPVNPVDGVAGATGNSAMSSSGALTTTNPIDVVVAANTVSTLTSGSDANFTQRLLTNPDGDIAEDWIATVAGPVSASAPLTDQGSWVMQIVAFRASAPADPAQFGMWSGPISLPMVSVHAALLPGGKILMSDGQSAGYSAIVWDPATNTVDSVPAPANIFCGATEQMADGKIVYVGGHAWAHTGLTAANVFDPNTESWTVLPGMAFPRWYPTATMLPDGRLIVTSGESDCDECDVTIQEIYDPSVDSWSQLGGAPFFFPYYPHVFLLPDGRVVVVATTEAPIVSQVLDLNALTWTAVGGGAFDGGSSAMYLPGKILKLGSSVNPDLAIQPSVPTAYVLDMTQTSPTWRQVTSMAYPRTYENTTLLPDGSVLVTGGGMTTDAVGVADAVLPAELWSPVTETWTSLAPMSAPRLYHSVALLLPDGRVVVSGGGRFNSVDEPTDQLSAEFFAPPYLFKGPRPAITSAPSQLSYGQNFTVETPDAGRIATVSLIRFGSVTHSFNMSQRFVPLAFSVGNGFLSITSPANPNIAPPGNYMLFLVDTNGVPSVAATVHF